MNIYMPTTSSPTLVETTATCNNLTIEIDEKEMAMGDLNSHDELRDRKTKSDTRDVDLAESLLEAEAEVMNTGEATRMDPWTERLMSPDITLVLSQHTTGEHWKVVQEQNPDHFAILFTVLLTIEAKKSECHL